MTDRTGPPDILVCAAGVGAPGGDPLELEDANWTEAWESDFMSVVRTARAFVPQMAHKGWGRAVFVASENAVQPYSDEASYDAAKAAVLNFSRALASAYGPRGVLVNAVSPAFIETPMTDAMMDAHQRETGLDRDAAVQDFIAKERPFLVLGRRGQPEEVAPVIAFLCSELSSFVLGANVRVDGGSVGTMQT